MTRFDRYVAAVLLAAMTVVLLALLGLTALFAMVEELREQAPGYGALEAMRYVGLTLPRRTTELVSYAVLLGAVIGLGELARHAEMTVVRASGMSVPRLFVAAAVPSLVVLALGAVLSENVAPRLETAAAEAKREQVRPAASRAPAGYWHRIGESFVNVADVAEDGTVAGVREYGFDATGRLVTLTEAARATWDPDTATWTLRDVRTSALRDAQVIAGRTALQARALDADLRSRPHASRARDPRQLTLGALWREIGRIDPDARERARLELAWGSRLLQPLGALGLVALALVFVIGPLREVTLGARIAAGIGVALAFKYLQDLFAPMAIVWALPPLLAVAIPIAVCWFAAVLGWRRVG